jgi:hypothetical protein
MSQARQRKLDEDLEFFAKIVYNNSMKIAERNNRRCVGHMSKATVGSSYQYSLCLKNKFSVMRNVQEKTDINKGSSVYDQTAKILSDIIEDHRHADFLVSFFIESVQGHLDRRPRFFYRRWKQVE